MITEGAQKYQGKAVEAIKVDWWNLKEIKAFAGVFVRKNACDLSATCCLEVLDNGHWVRASRFSWLVKGEDGFRLIGDDEFRKDYEFAKPVEPAKPKRTPATLAKLRSAQESLAGTRRELDRMFDAKGMVYERLLDASGLGEDLQERATNGILRLNAVADRAALRQILDRVKVVEESLASAAGALRD